MNAPFRNAVIGYAVSSNPVRGRVLLPRLDRTRDIFPVLTRGLSFDKPLREIQQIVVSETKEFFARETAPDGKKWAPLKNPRKRRKGGKILQDTGLLRSSIVSANRQSPAMVEWGTNVAYGKFHQGGTRRMVARPFIGVNQRTLAKIDRVIDRFEADVAKRLGAQ